MAASILLLRIGILILFCLYLAIYHGLFGLVMSLLAGKSLAHQNPFSRRALLLSPVVWVAVELARTRITGFPWDLFGISQVDNIPLSRIATVTGVYGLSFEIMVVNVAFAAAFLVRREKRNVAAGCDCRCRGVAGGDSGPCSRHRHRPYCNSGAGECAYSSRLRLDAANTLRIRCVT